jgi:hypothetical protein
MIASGFGLAGFAVAIIAGLTAGNSSERTLAVALVSMCVCHLVGLGVGAIAERMVEEHMDRYRSTRPLEVPGGDSTPNVATQAGTS